MFLSGDSTGQVIFWEMPSFRILSQFKLSGNISWAKINSAKKEIVLSTYFGPIYCLNLAEMANPKLLWQTKQSFYSYFNRSFDFDFGQNIVYAASIFMNTHVLKLNLKRNKLFGLVDHALNVYTIKQENNFGRLFSGGFSGNLKVTNLRSQKREKEFKGFHDSYISNIYCSRPLKLIFVADWKGKIKVLKSDSLQLTQELQISDSVYFLTFNKSNSVFFAGGRSSYEIAKFSVNC